MRMSNIVNEPKALPVPQAQDLGIWAKYQLERNNLFFPYLESRISVVLAVNVGLLAIIVLNLPKGVWQIAAMRQIAALRQDIALYLLSSLSVIYILRTLYFVFRVYVPFARECAEEKLGRAQDGQPLVVYFRGIAMFPTAQGYIDSIDGLAGQQRRAQHLAEEAHRTSRWLARGYDYLNESYRTTGRALILSLLTVVVCSFINHGVRIGATP